MTFETLTIEEATERLIDYRGKTPPKTESGIRLVTAKVIKDGRILDTPAEFISADFYDEWMRRGLPQPLDVLVTTEAPLGEVAILHGSEKLALAQRVILLRARSGKIDPRFLYYALQGEFAQGELRARASGTTVSGIKQSELRQARIPTFPLAVQRRIVDVLSSLDDLFDNNLRRIRILEDMVRALYREWFGESRVSEDEAQRSQGRLAAGWSLARLGDLAEETRRNVSKGSLQAEAKYVGLEHIPRRSLALDAWEELTELGSNKLGFKKGEVLFGKIRPYFHKVSVAPFDGVCSADTIVIRPTIPDDYGLVVATVSSDAFVQHATVTSNGSKMPRANWSVLREYPVAVPDRALAKRFTDFVMNVVSLQQNLVFQNMNLRQTRDLLLPRMLSGQLSLEEIDNNPARGAESEAVHG